tara:strand:- start:5327 stop:5539 length:213 start_codon:yes stop_codon:yes gene_type:complete
MTEEVENSENELTMDEHELLDLGAKAEIVLSGLRYAVVFQDLDILRKCVMDLRNCVDAMDEVLEDEFGDE